MAVATAPTSMLARRQISEAVSTSLGCQPVDTSRGLVWSPKSAPGVHTVILHPPADGTQQIEAILALIPETANGSARAIWALAARVVKETDLAAVPVAPTQDADSPQWQMAVRLTLEDTPFDIPRLSRLSQALEILDCSAKAMRAELPVALDVAPRIPRDLKDRVKALIAHVKMDSGAGNMCQRILPQLKAGLSVAMVGAPLRVRLELDRLAKVAPNIAILREPTPIQALPQLTETLRQAGLILASPCNLLRPRTSVYEQGRELDGALHELATSGLSVLTFGTREELESVFGVGQGRSYSPLLPVIQHLPNAAGADLVRAAFAERFPAGGSAQAGRLVDLVLATVDRHASGKEDFVQPLCNLAADRGPGDPGLPDALKCLAEDLAGRRDTFGTCDEAPATPRPADVSCHLRQQLAGPDFENLLRSRIMGQDAALGELAKLVWQETICRPDTEPLRVMLAGPVGTGKSVAAKYLAEVLDWPYYYIDATAFDSEHAVASSLAGGSPGLVNSFNDGVLTKISRRPSVVEVADLDHARLGVRGVICDFFLRILQEGTLQTGSGTIVRTLPALIFVFTSNVAYGTQKANVRLGFSAMTRKEVRTRVVLQAQESLGHAFISRVNEPIVFAAFTRTTALAVAENEIRSLVGRVCGASEVTVAERVVEQIIDSLSTTDTGARGIIDATRRALSEALRGGMEMKAERIEVSLKGQRIILKTN